MNHRAILSSKDAWLDDELINAAQFMLKEQYPLIGGFQSPILGSTLAMIPPHSEFVQVLLIREYHWIAISTVGCKPSTVQVYDSLGGRLPKGSLKLVADLMQTKAKTLSIEFVDVQKQEGGSDCGLFALAFIASICNGDDPTKLVYDQSSMRNHLLKCIEQGPFPSKPGRNPEKAVTKSVSIHCVCRLIDEGTKMIECAGCREWFHTACVQVEKKFIVNRKLKWFCPNCKAGV